MLDSKIHPAGEAVDGSPVAVLLHGRGSHMGDLQSLRHALPSGMSLVTPQGPHPGQPWGYGPGWAWYRYISGDRVDGPSLDTSLSELKAFLATLGDVLPHEPGPIVLGGFSQGGTTSMAYALRHPGAVAAVLNFSGFLANDDVLGAVEGGFESTPIFWGHGTEDPAISYTLAEDGRARLAAGGADLTRHDYPIGHWIAPEELTDVVAWLGERLG